MNFSITYILCIFNSNKFIYTSHNKKGKKSYLRIYFDLLTKLIRNPSYKFQRAVLNVEWSEDNAMAEVDHLKRFVCSSVTAARETMFTVGHYT